MKLTAVAAIDFSGYLLEGITPEILIRIGLAAVAGTLLGIEREKHGRAAGLRTTLLVCLASCIAMIISDAFYKHSFIQQASTSGWHPDPARLAAGVLSGMGFLGAGVIIRQSNHMVRGVTTAATLWFVTIIGLAFGAGAIGVGLVATVSSILILVLIPHLESRIKNDWYSDLGVTFSPSICSVDLLVGALDSLGVKVKGIDIDEDLEADRCHVILHLRYKRKSMVKFTEVVSAMIRDVPGVSRITFKS
ncbi:MAG: MgtC/SapB family protein [Verrucomicrobiota bacterium]